MLIELVLNAIVEGSLLSLICLGYSLAYGSARVINFAHADVMIAGGGYLVLLWLGGTHLGGFGTVGMAVIFATAIGLTLELFLKPTRLGCWPRLGLSSVVGIASGMVVCAVAGRLPLLVAAVLAVPYTAALATAVYRVGYLPLLRKGGPRTSVLLVALGFSIIVESSLLVLWGSDRQVFPRSGLPPALVVRPVPEGTTPWESIHFGVVVAGESIMMPVHDILIIVVFAIVALGVYSFFRWTSLGDSIVASADSPEAAETCGIPVWQTLGYAFFLGGAIASLGGTLYVLRAKSLDPMAGFSVGLLAFTACVIGGIGNLRGSVAGAFLISGVTSLAPALPLKSWLQTVLTPSTLQMMPSLNLGDWSYGLGYVAMILVILLRPQGLFRT